MEDLVSGLQELSIKQKVEVDPKDDFPFLNHDLTIDFIKKSKV